MSGMYSNPMYVFLIFSNRQIASLSRHAVCRQHGLFSLFKLDAENGEVSRITISLLFDGL